MSQHNQKMIMLSADMTLNDWIRQREITGFSTFSFEDVVLSFQNRSKQVLLNAIQREKKCGRIYSPYKSFYVIVPVHYVTRGSVPPAYYMDNLMRYLGKRYYMGLLTAAAFWGAAHQRSQIDYVFVEKPALKGFAGHSDVKVCGLSRFPFEHTVTRNGECGVVRYSNAELTACDLVQNARILGGHSVVATVLRELLESVDFHGAAEGVFCHCTTAVIQRLGYLVEEVLGDVVQGGVIYDEWRKMSVARRLIPLNAERRNEGASVSARWKIVVNEIVEEDD